VHASLAGNTPAGGDIMHASSDSSTSIADFTSQYDEYLLRVRGSAASTRQLHRHVAQRFLSRRFPDSMITWRDLEFSDCTAFVRAEFARLPSHDTQQTWLMYLRSVLRYLADAGTIPNGWDRALPKIASRQHARLPRQLSAIEVQRLFAACQKTSSRHVRDRALLLLLLRLGLRRQEVAHLTIGDVDWRTGLLRIRRTKTFQDRSLPLPDDVGHALVAHLRNCRSDAVRVFEPRRPPFTAERSGHHVANTIRALFVRAGIVGRGAHAPAYRRDGDGEWRRVLQRGRRRPGPSVPVVDVDLRQTRPLVAEPSGPALAGRWTMSVTRLATYLEDFLAMRRDRADLDKRSGRRRYQVRYTERLLRSFLAFWQERGCPRPIGAALALDWVTLGADAVHPHRDHHRVRAVRAFLYLVRAFEPDTEIPPNIFPTPGHRRRPYVLSDDEIRRLMQAPHALRCFDALRPPTLVTLMGLLASTGVRIGEALRLDLEDARLDADPPHLLILKTKFGKSRVVVLHPSTAAHLRTYVANRTEAFHGRDEASFFVGRAGRRLDYTSTAATFERLLRRAGIQPAAGQRKPTLHSFRHAFAVNCLTRWHRERRNVQEWLPHLSVYLGHLDPVYTYWYLSGTPELLQSAAALVDPVGQEGFRR
jgi:integrase/recombinase XerD